MAKKKSIHKGPMKDMLYMAKRQLRLITWLEDLIIHLIVTHPTLEKTATNWTKDNPLK